MRKSGAGVMSVGLIHLGAGLALSLSLAGMSYDCRDRPPPSACRSFSSGGSASARYVISRP
jgi:hypothetical protein